jgi:hypothetical protein
LKPAEVAWNRIAANAETAALISQVRTVEQEETDVERNAVDRGLGLPPSAPAPSVVKLSASAKAALLTVTVDMVHK